MANKKALGDIFLSYILMSSTPLYPSSSLLISRTTHLSTNPRTLSYSRALITMLSLSEMSFPQPVNSVYHLFQEIFLWYSPEIFLWYSFEYTSIIVLICRIYNNLFTMPSSFKGKFRCILNNIFVNYEFPGCNGNCLVFFYVLVSQTWPYEKIEKRLRKKSLSYSQVLEIGGTACHLWSHKEDTRAVKRQRGQNWGENLAFIWGFCRKSEAGQSKQFRIG